MARSLWTGSLSFGLVNVPVKLYSAVSSKDIRFHMLHDADGARIQQKRVCPVDGKEVPYDHIVKGFEVSPDHYVTITREELENLDPKATQTIDIQDFVSLEQIDPIYYEHTYYVVPGKTAANAYLLLVKAMERQQKVAIARVVMRGKQYLTAIRPNGRLLVMSTLLFADEVVTPETLKELPKAEMAVDERQLGMAEQLVQSLSTDFVPEKYHDEYRERVLELIEKKAEGQEVVAQPAAREPAKVVNLMEALEASLAESKRRRDEEQKREKEQAAKPSRKRKA